MDMKSKMATKIQNGGHFLGKNAFVEGTQGGHNSTPVPFFNTVNPFSNLKTYSFS